MKRILQLFMVFGAVSLSAQTPLFINEVHYDNTGADANEFIEIAGPANTDFDAATYTLELYKDDGTTYGSIVTLTGKLSDNGCGFGFTSVLISGIQNGPNDGFALIKDGVVLQFLSYEGPLTATAGTANGMTSTDIGVSEDGTGLDSESLQLTGTGSDYEDFTWASSAANTKDAINTGQTLEPTPENEIAFANATVTELESAGTVSVTLNLDKAAVSDGTVTVSIADNSATLDTDYSAIVGVLDVTAGQTSISFNVVLTDDTEVEDDETFTATIDEVSCLLSIGSTNSVTFTITDNDEIPVGIEEIKGEDIQIYPNPSNGVVNIKNLQNRNIEVYNSVGKLIRITSENRLELDKGMYILKVDSFSKTIVVE